MSRNSTEEWERTKWYLIRSLFTNIPPLSPIPETQEPSEPPLTSSVAISRPNSPLPDLIIEKEPNRHDEPEEYYAALEKRVKKFYKKLFIDSEKSSACSKNDDECIGQFEGSYFDPANFVEELNQPETSFRVDEVSNYDSRSIDRDSLDDKIMDNADVHYEKTSTEREEQSHSDRSIEIRKKTESIDHLKQYSNISSESCNYEIITTQAQVHSIRNEKSNSPTYYISAGVMQDSSSDNSKNVDPSDVTDIEPNGGKSECSHLEGDLEDPGFSNYTYTNSNLSNNAELMLKIRSNAMRCVTDVCSSPEETEIMRKRKTSRDSFESIHGLNIGRYFSEDYTTDKTLEIASVREMEEMEELTSDMSVILESNFTTKFARNTQGNKDRKRGILSKISSHLDRAPPKQKKFDNQAIQTSFSMSDDESNWLELQKHFFEGEPRILKLCYCNKHICCKV